MNNSQKTTTSGGIGFMGVLTIVFVVFKLLGKIEWSWWLVTIPIWGPFALLMTLLILIQLAKLLLYFLKKIYVK